MTDPIVDPDDLALYIGVDSIDADRAQLFIDLAMAACLTVPSVTSPLVDAARGIVLDIAARGYSNPQSVAAKTETVGPYSQSTSYSTSSSTGGRALTGGVWLTQNNRTALLALYKRSRALSVDMASAPMLATRTYHQW